MKQPSKEAKETQEQLQQQLNSLEEKWDSIKQSKPRNLRRSSSDSRTLTKNLDLLDNSPKKLMSSLQHRRSPSKSSPWNVRNNDLAILEIVGDRIAARESGKLKGRRLFEAEESGGDETSELRSVWSYDFDDDGEISYIIDSAEELVNPVHCSSSSSSSSFVCEECIEKEKVTTDGGETAAAVAVAANVEEKQRGGNGVKNWVAVGLIVLCVMIILIKGLTVGIGDKKGSYVHLVPT